MSIEGVEAFTVDTGGTVLDWHSGYRSAFQQAGQRHSSDRDWGELANDLRRRTMAAMLNLGEDEPPTHNFDDAHRFCLDALLADEDLEVFDTDDRRRISWDTPHGFTAWSDVRDGLSRIRSKALAVSFTILSYRLIIDSSRANALTWDAVLSCEGLGIYKLAPGAYRLAAERLQLRPDQCCMVACHPFDLDAARDVGFKTALVRRPDEWGSEAANPTPAAPAGTYDLEVDDFGALADAVEGSHS